MARKKTTPVTVASALVQATESAIVQHASVMPLTPTTTQRASEALLWFSEMRGFAAVMPFVTPEQFQLAGHTIVAIAEKRKELEEERKALSKPYSRIVDEIRATYKPLLDTADRAREAWEEALRRAEETRAATNTAAMQTATEAHIRGDDAAVAAAVATMQPAEQVQGIVQRHVWDFEVCNQGLLPAEYLTPDLPKIREAMSCRDEQGEPLPIPGVKFFQRIVTAVR